MTTIRAYTTIEQSRKLAKFLPLESADMCYIWDYERQWYTPQLFGFIPNQDNEGVEHTDIPCWSLASLLGVLPKIINNETLFIETSAALWHIGYRNIYTARADNPVDACYEMILKLNELNLL